MSTERSQAGGDGGAPTAISVEPPPTSTTATVAASTSDCATAPA